MTARIELEHDSVSHTISVTERQLPIFTREGWQPVGAADSTDTPKDETSSHEDIEID